MKYKCDGCGATKTLNRSTTVFRDGKWVTKEALCSCEKNKYMKEVLTKEHEGFPTIKRNDSAQKL